MKTNDPQHAAFSAVSKSVSDVFSDLVQLSGLRPQFDFQHARLAGVDFAGSNLSEFNFDYADLRGAKWANRLSDPSTLQYSLRGNGTNEVRGTDFKDFSAKVLSKALWAERFFAFQVLVDNWGENPDTVEVLLKLLPTKSGTYLPLCSFVYFSASYLNDNEAKTRCISMANAGGSQVNIYRLRKLRLSASQNAKYFKTVDMKPRYPAGLTAKELKPLLRGLSDMIDSTVRTENNSAL
ncbi:pentapeptide repeat-containing protein [Roseinatronobacter sp. S2]|uniref:pentapeptide repeat-containing protein n=1 Tax=Roseinatronobacter sp. S2 TaxID=3035471 RepID=UPI00240F417C|nr:pentapeptide repeat-containing protein [Roseinatronobacter sp. S2]WFE73306.1 pentapeptide repeat-containing protein [Roseinatronobacter sp. S2]